MPTPVYNYPNSFVKFAYDCDDKCLPRYDRPMPMPDGYFSVFPVNIVAPIPTEPAVYEYLAIPYPCDKWSCGGVINDYFFYAMVISRFGFMYTTDIWLQDYLLHFYGDNQYVNYNDFAPASPNAITFYQNYDIDISEEQYGCLCYLIIELKWNGDKTELLDLAIIAKSTTSYKLTESVRNECSIVGFYYVPNGFGFPSNYTNHYSSWVWGKVWKPTLAPNGKSYIKSNGERIALNEQFTESWQLDVYLSDYQYHKAANVALRCPISKVYNKDMQDFSEFNVDNIFGPNMNVIIDKEYAFTYADGCYSSVRGKATILNNEFSEGISYNC